MGKNEGLRRMRIKRKLLLGVAVSVAAGGILATTLQPAYAASRPLRIRAVRLPWDRSAHNAVR